MKALAAIRVQKIKSMSTIRAAEAHGRRLDEASSKRVDASRSSLNLAASQYSPDDPLALEAAYRGFRKATGAAEGKGAAIMAHMIAVISPEVLAETGDPRDPNNPKVRALFVQAQAWAQAEFGEESLVAARLDVDESGAGVVDLFVCPTAMQAGGRGRKPKLTISVKSGLEAVAAKNGNKRSYSAIQDSWGDWASQRIDRRLRRGKPKRETMRQHVHADLVREEYEKLDRLKAELDQREHEIAEKERKTADFIDEVARDNVRFKLMDDGQIQSLMRMSLSEERRAELVEAKRSFSPAVWEILRATTTLQTQAREAKKAAHDATIKAMQTGAEAFYHREVIGAEEAPETGWKIHYSSRLTEQRRGVLSAILEPFRAIVAPFIAAISRAVRGWEVTAEEVAEERNDSGWNYGPGM
ncbi:MULTISPECIES: hypothetical protein [unclassified Acetobacter]|uniref:Plasmid recombination enzyme n=2 Tax=Acetobacter pomorum TaxID=65959 RepID=F1YSK0_9PROT|nr:MULTISPECIES: hypothetical protein [unclassified Acetobacter]EGE48234.1 Hypothetical protein APO_0897 [Acetobacter pomorum DM001]KAA8391650.1 hypothetical protein FKW19_15240 [Acetobacter sp. DmW_125128]KAA8395151.1 hypothetical protein FKW22_09275 [Acetobacter sp. DmW_125124]KAA8395837.1 hypothetical protein FKW20_11725 [Acetobacter sp. DmW_125127]KAA8402111.1 hypothetical protein FKW32_14415 [Acetobacter sp. DmW_125132]